MKASSGIALGATVVGAAVVLIVCSARKALQTSVFKGRQASLPAPEPRLRLAAPEPRLRLAAPVALESIALPVALPVNLEKKEPPQQFGPIYPSLGTRVAKFRKIKNPTAEQRAAHGDAVSEAIRALLRAALQRELPTIHPSCASGTWHNNADGSIGRAIAQKQRAALLAWPERERKARSDATWADMYKQSMAEKRANERRTKKAA